MMDGDTDGHGQTRTDTDEAGGTPALQGEELWVPRLENTAAAFYKVAEPLPMDDGTMALLNAIQATGVRAR